MKLKAGRQVWGKGFGVGASLRDNFLSLRSWGVLLRTAVGELSRKHSLGDVAFRTILETLLCDIFGHPLRELSFVLLSDILRKIFQHCFSDASLRTLSEFVVAQPSLR